MLGIIRVGGVTKIDLVIGDKIRNKELYLMEVLSLGEKSLKFPFLDLPPTKTLPYLQVL